MFYPSWLNEIQPKEFVKAKKLAREITLSEFEIDPDEWRKITEENAMVRILEGGKKILVRKKDFYDNEILKNLTSEWQKATRVIDQHTASDENKNRRCIYHVADERMISYEGRIDITGDINGSWKEFDVKLPGKRRRNDRIWKKTNEL